MRTIETEFNHALATTGSTSPLSFDPTRYRTEVDQFDITEEQKQELLTILWSIMRSFVELGFDVDVCAALLSDNDRIPTDTETG